MPVAQIGGTNQDLITPFQGTATVVSPMEVVNQTLSGSSGYSDITEGLQKGLALMQRNAAEIEKAKLAAQKEEAEKSSYDTVFTKYAEHKATLASTDMSPEERKTRLDLVTTKLLIGSSMPVEMRLKVQEQLSKDNKDFNMTKYLNERAGIYIDKNGQAKQTPGAAGLELAARVLEGSETMLSVLPAEWSKAVLGEKDPVKQQNLIQQMLPYAAEQKSKANALNVALHEQELLNKKLTATKTRMDIADSSNASVAKATTARLYVDTNMILTNAARGLQPRQFDGKPFNPNDKTAYVVEPLNADNMLNLVATLRNYALTSPTIAEQVAKGNRAVIQGVADHAKSLNALEGVIRNMTKEGKDISKLRGAIASGALKDLENMTPEQLKEYFKTLNTTNVGGWSQLLGTGALSGLSGFGE